MKRWLIVASDFITTGGMDVANYSLARFLSARGDLVELVGHRVESSLAALPNVRHHRVPRPLGSDLLAQPVIDVVGRRWARRVRRDGGRVIVNGGNCAFGDVCWVHYLHAAYRPEIQGSLARRAHRALAHRVGVAMEAKALRRARLVVANSERTAADLERHYAIPRERIAVVHLGIDPARFHPPSEAERRAARAELALPEGEQALVFIGALTDRRKGFDTVFEAWRRSSGGGRLFVVGQGAEVPSWRARIEAASLGDRVRFLGYRHDVDRLLAAMDALIAPTRYEAFGLAVLEALCRGVPALVSRSAGVAELYPPELAPLLIDAPEDADALGAQLDRVRAQLPELRARAVSHAAQLRRFSWESMAARIVEAIER